MASALSRRIGGSSSSGPMASTHEIASRDATFSPENLKKLDGFTWRHSQLLPQIQLHETDFARLTNVSRDLRPGVGARPAAQRQRSTILRSWHQTRGWVEPSTVSRPIRRIWSMHYFTSRISFVARILSGFEIWTKPQPDFVASPALRPDNVRSFATSTGGTSRDGRGESRCSLAAAGFPSLSGPHCRHE